MGCSASRQKYDSFDLLAAKPQPLKAVVPGSKLLTQPNTYELASKIFRLREDIDIKDSSGAVAFKILGKLISLRDRQYFSDSKGNKVAMLQKKLLTIRPTYILYSYEPNFAGQPSVDTDGGKPIYRMAMIQSVLLSLPRRFTYKIYTAESGNLEPEEAGEISTICSMYHSGTMVNKSGEPMWKLTQTGFFSGNAGGSLASGYKLEVCAGMDPMQAICAAIAVDQLLSEGGGDSS